VQARRTGLLVGLGGAAIGLVSAAIEQGSPSAYLAGAAVGGALGAVPRHPHIAWITATIALCVAAPFTALPFGVILLASVHAFYAGREDERWWAIAGLIALAGGLELDAYLQEESGVPALLFPGAAWAAGRALNERELVAAQLAERARELEEEREAHAALSVRFERARIAAELHDIVAHAISVMVVQAGAGQRIAAVDPELTGETFQAIAGAARQAEQDMTQLVALLAADDAIAQAPDLTLVEELVARAAGTGLDVTLRLEGSREGLPASAVQTVYRVVRESLTNALRYASGAPVHVLVRGGPAAIDVEVVNDGAADAEALAGHGTGNGLRGLRERVGAAGGRLEAGPRESGGWRVAAWIPCAVAVAVEDGG
jgi:signal transduction histidine kinase